MSTSTSETFESTAMTTNQKPTKTEQLSLAFEIYHRIPRGRKVTAQALQLELASSGIERDIRTIQRNLDIIVQYLDVDKDNRSKPYGYSRRLNSRYVLGPRETVILQLAKSLVTKTLPSTMNHAVEAAFLPTLNHQRTYPGIQQPAIDEGKILTVSKNWNSQSPNINQLFEPLSLALTYQRMIALTLTDNQNLARIKPLGLVHTNQGFHLVYQKDDKDAIDIPLDKIDSIKVSTFHFDFPPSFQLSKYRLTTNTTDI